MKATATWKQDNFGNLANACYVLLISDNVQQEVIVISVKQEQENCRAVAGGHEKNDRTEEILYYWEHRK